MTRRTTTDQLSRMLSIPKSRALQATLKAQLIAAAVREVCRRGLTHAELAHRSGLPRSAVTGILAGSLRRAKLISEEALPAHLRHGDTESFCPEDGAALVCHRGTKTRVARGKRLATHLRHGDTLGACLE